MKLNKNILTFILLASSGLVYSDLTQDIMNDHAGGQTLEQIKASRSLTKNQVKFLTGIDLSNETSVKEALIKANFADDEDQRNDKIKAIYSTAGTGNKISSKPHGEYSAQLSQDQYEKIAEYEYKSGGSLSQSELYSLLTSGKLSDIPGVDEPKNIAIRIIKLASYDKVTARPYEDYKYDLSTDEYEAIRKFELSSGGRIKESELKEYLETKTMPKIRSSDKARAILSLVPEDGKVSESDYLKDIVTPKQLEVIKIKEKELTTKISESLLKKILEVSDSDLDEMIKPEEPPKLPETDDEKVYFILNLTGEGVKLTGLENKAYRGLLSDKQIADIKAQELKKGTKINFCDLMDILTGRAPSTRSEPPKVDLAAQVFELVAEGKIDAKHASALKKLDISEAIITKLLAATDLNTKEQVDAILKSTAPTTTSLASDKITPPPVDITAEVLKLANRGKLSVEHKEALRNLNLTPEQITKLLAAGILDSPAKVNKILKPDTTIISGGNQVNGGQNTNSSANSDDGSLYTNPWILGFAGLLIVAGIAGGVYLMTSKTEETDL